MQGRIGNALLSLYLVLLALATPFTAAHPAGAPALAKTNSTITNSTTKGTGHKSGHTIQHNGVTHRVCGTEHAGDHVVSAHKDLHALHKHKPHHRVLPRGELVHEGDLWDVIEKRGLGGRSLEGRGTDGIVVDTYVHYVSTDDQKDNYAPDEIAKMVAQQGNVLNTAYAPLKVSFNLHPHTFHVNDAWATDSDSAGMKSSLRQGAYSALNLYFQTNLSAPTGAPAGSAAGGSSDAQAILGYCTLPTSVTYTPSTCTGASGSGSKCAPQSQPPTEYHQDGCSILASTLPDGSLTDYNMGRTAVHESGHWFGLLHTFQDESCDAKDPGDYVDDTPQESEPTSGCPTNKNSCPGRQMPSGVTMFGGGTGDAVGNYMDYSSDECYTGFSQLQQARVLNMWHVFRSGN